jgi:hypothetical protein
VKFVGDYKNLYGAIPDALAATAYDAAKIMFDAIKRANSLDGKAIRDALAATKDFPGVTGKVTFNSDRDAVKPIVMIEIKDGGTYAVAERVQVDGAAMPTTTEAATPSPASSASPGSAASPAKSTGTPAKSEATPAKSTASPAKPMGTPAK